MRNVWREHRLIITLVAVQSACLVTGLWTHLKFLDAHVAWSKEHLQATDSGPPHKSGQTGLTFEQERFLVHVLSFLWIAALQTTAACLTVTRLRGQQERQQLQSQEAALLHAKELLRTRDAIVFGLAKLAESRDPETGMHLERIALYSTRLASAIRKQRRFRDEVTQSFVNLIGISSALHDIGKVGVEDAILLKPGTLTAQERHRIQLHARLGGECIRQIERRLGASNFLEMAREIALHHHERWDGRGYPDGLAGNDIPLAARIVAIADVYDALRMKRVYKDARSHEDVIELIRSEAGSQFDPDLVEVLLTIEHQFRDIADRYAETPVVKPRREATSRDLQMTPEDERLLTMTVQKHGPAEPAAPPGSRNLL